ncbi:MAG TPA: tetratricopeptide repeat protein, partial [Tepidisphaeraceae bacterium]|nr:tetratricopeptide repeat protein [Tepidisphaeraceae bacterium]
DAYRRGLAAQPTRFESWNNLGNALQKSGRPDEAMSAYRQAIALRPEYADAWNNLGNVLQEQKQWDQAIAHFQRAIGLQPSYPEAWNNLANALAGKKQLEQAIGAYQKALEQRPEFPSAWYNLANSLQKTGELDQALAALKKAIALQPDYTAAYQNLGNVLKDMGRLGEAIAAYRRAIEMDPGSSVESCLLLSLLYSHEYTPQQVWEDHVRWDQRVSRLIGARIRPHPNDRSHDRRLRIGYVSGDFRHHVVGYNIMPLFREHNYEAFEIFCYSNTQEPDAYTEQFRSRAQHWHDIKELKDDEAAELIRQDRIDILVDLSLHTGHNRLLMFARKPAPIQVTFAGYPGTTGLSRMDYRLTDPYLDPPEAEERFSSEKPLRLADAFWCYDPRENRPPVGPLPAIANGYVTFGCLNNFCKVNEAVLKLWSRVLRQVPRSRLLMLAPRGSHRDRTIHLLESFGIEPGRLEFVGPAQRDPYLRYYNRIDVGLDTFPYNGHTTSLDSYCMGVPVVTLVGTSPLSRAGWCQLTHLNLRELAAESEEQFVSIASSLAGDVPRLTDLRASLRGRLEASPLMDPKRFARNIETAYRQMWAAWCASGDSTAS